MAAEPSFTKIKDDFYLVTRPEIRENPWYLTRKPGRGTYVEIANDIEIGVYIAPWPFNKRLVIEEHSHPELRKMWDKAGIPEVVQLAYDEIIRQVAAEEDQ
jgi:hypothetical protein